VALGWGEVILKALDHAPYPLESRQLSAWWLLPETGLDHAAMWR
jgi:hypothetical protein